MPLSGWKPLHDAHAIQTAVALVQFQQRVTEVPWRKISDLGQTKARNLGLTVVQPITEFEVGPKGSTPAREVGYDVLRLTRPDVFAEKLSLQRNFISYESWEYTRWAAFETRLHALVLPLLQHYLNAVPVTAIGVEYLDRFDATDDKPDAGEIISSNSDMISRKSFRPHDFWHSHAGWTEKVDQQSRRLTNVDVNVLEVRVPNPSTAAFNIRRVIEIRTSIHLQFNQHGMPATNETKFTDEFVCKRWLESHVELKDILSSVITEDAAKRISLTGENDV
jgi:uncharacterized protein (TIGR04255 family)